MIQVIGDPLASQRASEKNVGNGEDAVEFSEEDNEEASHPGLFFDSTRLQEKRP
jgi:hypothetical protein